MMPDERRVGIRKPLEHIAYLSLPSDNGGIVMDVSEGGLRFRSIAPVQGGVPIQFRFALDSATRIAAIGELAWSDASGKAGGLRFTEMPDGMLEQIRLWALQSSAKKQARPSAGTAGGAKTNVMDVQVLDAPVSPPAAAAKPAPARPADLAAVASVAVVAVAQTKVAPDDPRDSLSLLARGYPYPHLAPPPIYRAAGNKLSMFTPASSSGTEFNDHGAPLSELLRHPLAAIGLTIALAFLVSIGIFSLVFTSTAGDVVAQWGESIWAGSYAQPIPQVTFAPASPQDSSKTRQR